MKTILRTAALLMLVACSKGEEAPAPGVEFSSSTAAKPAAATATAAAAVPAASGPLTLVSADGARTITITTDGSHVEVSVTGGARYIGDADGGKRRYRDAATGAAFVEVKSGDNNSFKVRTPDSKLLWKVKVDTDKIKVSDNEENQNPWVLKTKYDDKAKVLDPTEKEIGEVKYYRDSGKAKVKDASGAELQTSESGRMSPAFGVSLMSGVPEDYRLIVMAELIARGI
ncbi:MAG: hypothetical protein NDJ92_19070 [Thermoanaerobaculia bacterium]|nr:hypothetical protein [Thermoanaerobaculia bacterium]